MSMRLGNRQNLSYAGILVSAFLVTSFSYYKLNQEWIVFRKAENRFAQREYSAAIPLYEEAVAGGIRSATPRHHLGESYLALGQFQDALRTYEGLSRLYPEDLYALKNLAALYDHFHRLDDAIALYHKVDGKASLDVPSLLRLADLNKRKQAFEAAQAVYGRILARDPASIPARMGLAELLGWTKRYDEAISLYRKILEDHPDYGPARVHLARVLSWSGRREEAIEEYRKALKEASAKQE